MNARLLVPFGMIAFGLLQFAAEESPSRGVVPEEFVRAQPGKQNRPGPRRNTFAFRSSCRPCQPEGIDLAP